MQYDVTDTLAKLVRRADSNFDQEIEEQDEVLRGLKCTNPYFREWLKIGVELVFSIFELEDDDFAQELPELAHMSKTARRRFRKHLEAHIRNCDHCALKQQNEMALNAKIKEAISDNRELLLTQLQEELCDSNSQIPDTVESYLCAPTRVTNTAGTRLARFQYRQHPKGDGH